MANQPRQKVVTKKLIPATIPDMTPDQRIAYDLDQARLAAERTAAIARENEIPQDASVTLRFRLCKHGRHWQAYAYDERRRRWYGLLPAPSLLSSALGILESEQYRQAVAS